MGKKYISEEEIIKCEAVISVFQELYNKEDIIALVAGNYGIVVLQWYSENWGFEQMTTFTNYIELYKYLWNQWREYELYRIMEGTEWEEADFETMYRNLEEKNKKRFREKRLFFWMLLLNSLQMKNS